MFERRSTSPRKSHQPSLKSSISGKLSRWFVLLLIKVALLGCSTWHREPSSVSQQSPTPILHEAAVTLTSPKPHLQILPTLTATPLPTRQPTATPLPEVEICSPLYSTPLDELAAIVSDGFHPPPPGQDGRHQGVDFAYYRKFGRASIAGESVQAVLAGKIAAAIQDRFPYGNLLIVETPFSIIPAGVKAILELSGGESLYVLYAHLAELYPIQMGEAIASCQPIGTVGKSGNAGVAHLHLEMRVGIAAQSFPSMAYYVAEATPEERQTYLRWRVSGEFRAVDPMLILTEPLD